MEVRVIDYKAGILPFILAAKTDLVPNLAGDTPQGVTPFYARILYESVVDILLCCCEFLKRGPLERNMFRDHIRAITIKAWNTPRTEYIVFHLLLTLRVNRSVILISESIMLMVCMASVRSLFLKNLLISEIKGIILCVDIG